MGLFTRNFDKPGPGVSPDAPRKKGAARFFEILGRDFSTIWLAGILAMLGGLPFAAGVWFAVETHSLVPLVIAGVLGGMIAAPQIVGLNDTILRTLRDEPGYWWETYRRAEARHTGSCTTADAVDCARRALRDGGRFLLCQRPEQLAEILAALRAARLEPKRLAFVKNRPDAAPWLFLVEAQKGRKTGLRVEPDILIQSGAALYGPNTL